MDVDGTPYSTKIICSLSPPVAMGLGCNVLSAFESRTIGLQFGTISERVSASSPFTMASVFKMLILDSILYFMMARYFDLVKQGPRFFILIYFLHRIGFNVFHIFFRSS